MDKLDKDFAIDWAFLLCDMDFIKWCVAHNIDPNDLEPFCKAAWRAGATRVYHATHRWEEAFQELVG